MIDLDAVLAHAHDNCAVCEGTGVVRCWSPGGPCPDGQTVCESCGPCQQSDVPALVAALREARAERDAYKRAKQENDERFMLERDDWRRRYEALRDGVTGLHEQSPGVILHCAICGLGYPCATVALVRSIENPSPPVRRACPVHHSTSCGCAALSVEGDES